MRDEYIKLIENLDKVIHEIRALWMSARNGDKAKWMAKINELLDTRITLMTARDAAKALNA